MPALANDDSAPQKPALIKGAKSYQARYTKTDKEPQSIEPAAGDEAKKPTPQDTAKHKAADEDTKSEKFNK